MNMLIVFLVNFTISLVNNLCLFSVFQVSIILFYRMLHRIGVRDNLRLGPILSKMLQPSLKLLPHLILYLSLLSTPLQTTRLILLTAHLRAIPVDIRVHFRVVFIAPIGIGLGVLGPLIGLDVLGRNDRRG